MEPRVAPLARILELNRDLLLNCLDGLSDAEARTRLAGGGNSVAFLAAHLASTLAGLSAADLARPDAHRFPFPGGTRLGLLSFLVQHDSYHVGQLAFLRRQLGKPAMSYVRGSGAA